MLVNGYKFGDERRFMGAILCLVTKSEILILSTLISFFLLIFRRTVGLPRKSLDVV